MRLGHRSALLLNFMNMNMTGGAPGLWTADLSSSHFSKYHSRPLLGFRLRSSFVLLAPKRIWRRMWLQLFLIFEVVALLGEAVIAAVIEYCFNLM